MITGTRQEKILNLSVAGEFVSFEPTTCQQFDLINYTDADIEYRREDEGATITIPAGNTRLIIGVTSTSDIEIKRKTGTTAVTIQAETFNSSRY